MMIRKLICPALLLVFLTTLAACSSEEDDTAHNAMMEGSTTQILWPPSLIGNYTGVWKVDQESEVEANITVGGLNVYIDKLPCAAILRRLLPEKWHEEAAASVMGDGYYLFYEPLGYTNASSYYALSNAATDTQLQEARHIEWNTYRFKTTYGGEDHYPMLIFSPASSAIYDSTHSTLTILLKLSQVTEDEVVLEDFNPELTLTINTLKKITNSN